MLDKMQIPARKDGQKLFRWVTLADGLTDEYSSFLFNGSSRPFWKDARMMNAATGKMEYLSPEWVEKEEWRKAFEDLRSQLSQKRNSWTITEEMVRSHLERMHK